MTEIDLFWVIVFIGIILCCLVGLARRIEKLEDWRRDKDAEK